MNTTGQLDLGIAQVTRLNSTEVIGYVYTVPSGKGQLQRWLLFCNPDNSFSITAAPKDMSSWTLGDFQANIPKLWRPGSFYVWAQADVYRQGETYNGVTWTQIPEAASLPAPTYPDIPGVSFQLDPGGCIIMAGQQGEAGAAMVFTTRGLADASSVEYWMLLAGYQPSGANATAGVSVGVQCVGSLDGFISTANRSFGDGASFVITGCVNYTGQRAPAYA